MKVKCHAVIIKIRPRKRTWQVICYEGYNGDTEVPEYEIKRFETDNGVQAWEVGVDFGGIGSGFGKPKEEKLIRVKFKDPQLPPGENVREKYVNLAGTVREAIMTARDALTIPDVVPIALLAKGRRMNPDTRLADYEITEGSVILIVPDQIKGG